ncbi:Protein of unknown function [Cotesia congregata]|uniref:Uncharacterized protein n=1 Tax=Cotesia congregata TaxID=51543 RepID=A0A8J2HRN4_COTCN|nr:Protein of unknown function [Cotesia congregata]
MEQTYSDSTGVIMAITYNLTPTRAGTAVIESHFGNYHYRNPVNLEIDPTKPISLMYSNDKLVVTFSTRLIKQS